VHPGGVGLAAVAVEPLARTLGVTKGSFYARYRNRDELIAAALAEWVRSHGEGGLAEFVAIADPAQRLRELLTVVVQAVQPLAPWVIGVRSPALGDRRWSWRRCHDRILLVRALSAHPASTADPQVAAGIPRFTPVRPVRGNTIHHRAVNRPASQRPTAPRRLADTDSRSMSGISCRGSRFDI
jgi:AcrR family transcriptional regulator